MQFKIIKDLIQYWHWVSKKILSVRPMADEGWLRSYQVSWILFQNWWDCLSQLNAFSLASWNSSYHKVSDPCFFMLFICSIYNLLHHGSPHVHASTFCRLPANQNQWTYGCSRLVVSLKRKSEHFLEVCSFSKLQVIFGELCLCTLNLICSRLS